MMLFQASQPIHLHFESSRTFAWGFVIALAPIGVVIMLLLRARQIKRTVAIAKEAYRQVKATHFAAPSSPESPGNPGAPASPAVVPAGSNDATQEP